MGADFSIAYVPSIRPLTAANSERHMELDAVLDGLTDEDFELWDSAGLFSDEDPQPEVVRANIRTALLTVLSTAFARRRDVTQLVVVPGTGMGPVHAWLTGGQTWGDPPTEAYSAFQVVVDAPTPVWELVAKWSREDYPVET